MAGLIFYGEPCKTIFKGALIHCLRQRALVASDNDQNPKIDTLFLSGATSIESAKNPRNHSSPFGREYLKIAASSYGSDSSELRHTQYANPRMGLRF